MQSSRDVTACHLRAIEERSNVRHHAKENTSQFTFECSILSAYTAFLALEYKPILLILHYKMACRWIDPQKKKKENLHLDRQVCREFEL